MLRICIINGRSVPCFFSQSAMGRFLRDEKHFIIRMAFKKKYLDFLLKREEQGCRALPSLRCIFNTSEHPDKLGEKQRVLCC